MNDMKYLIKDRPLRDARSAFYYLGRYLKQAVHDDYQKNIFDDDSLAVVDEGVKELTNSLILFIEEKQGKPAKEFSDEEYMKWMDVIDSIETSLDPNPSTELIEQAEKVIKELVIPTLGKH
jgi:hypothetical protein